MIDSKAMLRDIFYDTSVNFLSLPHSLRPWHV